MLLSFKVVILTRQCVTACAAWE